MRKYAASLVLTAFLAAQTPPERQLLLNPKALPPAAQDTEEALRKGFTNPAAEYRSMPLWVWNDLHDWPRLREMLGQYKAAGMGGAFVHPRPGLMTDYLSPEWFRLWKLSLEEGKRLGLLVNIYDENSYPSGFAGGHVPANYPDTAAQYVQAEEIPVSAMYQRRGVSVAFFAVEKNTAGEITGMKRILPGGSVPPGWSLMAFRLRRASGNPWTAEFPYVDLTNPRTTPAFLETTYEKYKQQVGLEFGKAVKWVFTDEPLIATAGAYDSARLALPMSYNTLAEFQRRNGYDLADHLPSLYWDVGDFRKVRFDYWQTLHDLWKENFMKPMFEWCDRNNLQFTGHWMEHEWPYPWITPADANLYAFEHVPGIDLLEGTKLRLEGKDPHLLFTIKQVTSVSHQLERRAFCEAYGVAGWDSTFEHYKRFGDWLMVHGINFMNQHLSFATIRGARKRDHPQSFSDVSAWWPYYKTHGDHLGRVSYLSSRSLPKNRLLVLQQTTSGFLLARRAGPTPELERMRANNAEMNQFLADHQVDFDLGDEYMIEWFGEAGSRKFRIGKASYDLLVIPPDMNNFRKQTLPLIEKYLAAGGEVLALSPPAAFVDGRPSGQVEQLRRKYAAQWHEPRNLSGLLGEVRKRLKPKITFDSELPSGIGFSDRVFSNGDRWLMLTNTGLSRVRSNATVEGGALEEWDTVSGAMKPAVYETPAAGQVRFSVDLPPAASMVLFVKKNGQPAKPAAAQFARIETGEWRAEADSPNVLVLDYCDYTVYGVEKKDANTWAANWDIWQRHGFERPAWDNAVQFRKGVFERNKFGKGSGFEAVFRFEAAGEEALKGLELAMEAPELYRVTLNGKPVLFTTAKRWLDPHLMTVSVEKLARVGVNEVRIAASPFDVKMELENIYLRGNFAVEAAARGFRIHPPAGLKFGSWREQGYPFYGDAVTYSAGVAVPPGSNRLKVELPEWLGSVAVVLLDGKPAATIGWQPHEAEFAVTPGKHEVGVRIVSTPRNVMGPFHNPAKPRMRAWPAAWAEFPPNQPPGAAYDLLDYGLNAAPVVSAGN